MLCVEPGHRARCVARLLVRPVPLLTAVCPAGLLPGQVLHGVHLVFTRVIPLEMEPSSHPLWRLAESFGARCSTTLDARTTHVVAGASGTEKVLQVRGKKGQRLHGEHIVRLLALTMAGWQGMVP